MTRTGKPVDPRLAALARLGETLHQAELARLSSLMAEARRLRAQVAGLDRPPVADPDLDLVVQQATDARYRIWADRKREDLNTALARKLGTIEEAREKAARAFGRSMVLRRLTGGPPDMG
jgi:2-phospho-L-lactate guanylyltransferase (CobY/MobA/RfbA family)